MCHNSDEMYNKLNYSMVVQSMNGLDRKDT